MGGWLGPLGWGVTSAAVAALLLRVPPGA